MTALETFDRRAFDQRGFTMVELLVVILIVGALAAIAIPVFLSQQHKAHGSAMASDLRTTASELESYYSSNQSYPSWLDGESLSGNVTIDDELLKLTAGDTVRVDYNSDGSAYCLTASSRYVSERRYYISDRGGLMPTSTSGCGSF